MHDAIQLRKEEKGKEEECKNEPGMDYIRPLASVMHKGTWHDKI